MVDYLRHLFIPHHTNNFRARLLHYDVFAFYVIAFFVLTLSLRLVHHANPDILGFATNIQIDQLVSLTNTKREQEGLADLKINAQLSQAAQAKAEYMFSHDYWAHTAPDGTTPWDFINGAGYVYTVAGENLAKNFDDSAGVIEAWMNSPTHRENILRPQYKEVGFAIVNGVLQGEETTLVVQMFGDRLNSSSLSQISQTAESPSVVETAQATEIVESPIPVIVSPSPTVVIAQASEPNPPQALSRIAGSVNNRPLLDINALSKEMIMGISAMLMILLVVDGWYIWRKKIIRVSGRNMAHLMFLGMITGVVWFMSVGSII